MLYQKNILFTYYRLVVTVYLLFIFYLDISISQSNKEKVKNTELKIIIKFLLNLLQKNRIKIKKLKVLIRKTSGFFVTNKQL